MIITRKIEIYIHEADKELKSNYQKTLYDWRDAVRKAANMIVSHRFVQQNIRDFMYLQDDVLERLDLNDKPFVYKDKKTDGYKLGYKNAHDIIKDEKGLSEQNTTYRMISAFLKGKVNSDIYSCLNQIICKSYKETAGNIAVGESSLRSYKNNIPIPFSPVAISNIHSVTEEKKDPKTEKIKKITYYDFSLFGIPFRCHLGQDRSNNEAIINRCKDGELKICSSSIAFEKKVNRDTGKKKNKLFLYLCVDMPEQKVKIDKKKAIYAYLGIANPIIYCRNVKAKNEFDSGVKFFKIGTKKEFLDRRIEIQNAVRRCQINNRYAKGGKGRKRKCQALDRFHEKEKNYVNTKLHTYSRMLVDAAVKNGCGVIYLVNQTEREKKSKEDNQKGDLLVLRNWSYFSLKSKIEYKAKIYGIEIKSIGKEESDDEAIENDT